MTATLRLAAVGDIMLGDHPVCFGHGIRSAARRHGLHKLLEEAIPILIDHDIFLGNLECVLSDFAHDPKNLSSSEMRGDPAFAPLLNICDHNVFSVANNHMLQHGPEAFEETCDALCNSGSIAIGRKEGMNSNVHVVSRGDLHIAFIAHSFRPEHFCDTNNYYAQSSPEAVVEQIKRIKASHPEYLVVLSIHWGEEYLHAPSQSQIEWGHQFIDAGTTLVLGHHPHTLQGVEEYKGGVIAYSLGNFLFDSWQPATRETAIFSCEISISGVLNHRMIPACIDEKFFLRFGTLQANNIEKKLASYNSEIRNKSGLTALTSSEYANLAEKTYLKYRIECYAYFLTHIWKYQPRTIYESLFRSALRRIGLA